MSAFVRPWKIGIRTRGMAIRLQYYDWTGKTGSNHKQGVGII